MATFFEDRRSSAPPPAALQPAPRPGPLRRLLLAVISILLALFGSVVLFTLLARLLPIDPGPHLLEDTWAWMGGGEAVTDPQVSAIQCSQQHYGGSGSGPSGRFQLMRFTEYQCTLRLGTPVPPPVITSANPYAGMTARQAAVEYERLEALTKARNRALAAVKDHTSLQRTLPRDLSGGPLPQLRRLTGGGTEGRYGVVWGGAELGRRWLSWGALSLTFGLFAAGCLVAARVAWRRRGR
jgi:hypothetical protein